MPSKYFVPKEEDLKYETIIGQFPCQIDDCDEENSSARWYKSIDVLAWECPVGHINKEKASDYV